MADDTSSLSDSASQRLSSSTSSLPPAKLCSQTYKNASQLYLTRRLQESLAALEPVIAVPVLTNDEYVTGDEEKLSLAPIATAPSTWRIKIWNLYITLLSAIVDLGAEEGKQAVGHKTWKDVVAKVRDGTIWETVVQTGYRGFEGSVDAEVVYNLATLLLTHSPSQALNQQRLETYLSSYGQPILDITEHLESPSSHRHKTPPPASGTDTPKDLAARVRIIELFTLHVLPRNEEWEYAREFISFSEVLDEERKELFLQTLEGLKEEKERGELRAAELQRQKDAELARQKQEAERQIAEETAAAAAERSRQQSSHQRSSSEVDYGVDQSRSNGTSTKGKAPLPSSLAKPAAAGSRASLSQPAGSSGAKSVKKTGRPAPASRTPSSRAVLDTMVELLRRVSRTIAGNPLSLLRTLLFIVALVMALSRQDVRDRIRRITGAGWKKLKGTVGMGVKVSYI